MLKHVHLCSVVTPSTHVQPAPNPLVGGWWLTAKYFKGFMGPHRCRSDQNGYLTHVDQTSLGHSVLQWRFIKYPRLTARCASGFGSSSKNYFNIPFCTSSMKDFLHLSDWFSLGFNVIDNSVTFILLYLPKDIPFSGTKNLKGVS